MDNAKHEVQGTVVGKKIITSIMVRAPSEIWQMTRNHDTRHGTMACGSKIWDTK